MPESRALIYARLSKDAAKTEEGVDRQLRDARQLARMRGYIITAEHVDNDLSAAGGKHRPGFEALLQDVEHGRVDIVIAWNWDRLSRNRRDTLRLIETGQERKLTVALVRGSDIDMSTASGRLVADLLAGVARAEIDSKGERQRRAGLQRAEAGKPPARRAFGYLDGGQPHPQEAPVVARMFADFLAGATLTGIARALNGEGWTTARGAVWTDGNVRVVLTNPRYIAERWYRGAHVTDGDWLPLVTPESFAAARSILGDDARKHHRPARKHLGSGLYRCWCGSLVTIGYNVRNQRVYICAAQRHMQRLGANVDQLVRHVITARLSRDDVADLLKEDDHADGASKLRQEAIGVRGRLDSLAADYADGILTARQVQVATRRLESRLQALEAQLAEVGRVSALASVAGAPDPAAAWLELPLDRQQAVLDALVTVVIMRGAVGRGAFDPNTIRFDWRTAVSDDVLAKIRCDQCGQLLCRVVAVADTGRIYYRSPLGGGVETLDPGAVFCADHGWPDLNDAELADKIARRDGQVVTHRARMHPRRPAR